MLDLLGTQRADGPGGLPEPPALSPIWRRGIPDPVKTLQTPVGTELLDQMAEVPLCIWKALELQQLGSLMRVHRNTCLNW